MLNLLRAILKRKHVILKHKRYKIEIFDRPSLWMKKEKIEILQKRIVNIAITKNGKVQQTPLFFNPDALKNKIIVITSKDSNDLTFSSMIYNGKHKGKKIMHMGPSYSNLPNKGLMQLGTFYCLINFVFKNFFRKFYITNITHVPKIYGVLQEAFQEVFPPLNPGTKPKNFHLDIKQHMIDKYIKEIEPDQDPEITDDFVIKEFRIQQDGSMLFSNDTAETVPKHRKDIYNKRCLDLINFKNGDVLLIIGYFSIIKFFKHFKLFKK